MLEKKLKLISQYKAEDIALITKCHRHAPFLPLALELSAPDLWDLDTHPNSNLESSIEVSLGFRIQVEDRNTLDSIVGTASDISGNRVWYFAMGSAPWALEGESSTFPT
jgi:hypothetical protein